MVERPSHFKCLKHIDEIKQRLKKNDVIKELFDKHGLDINEIDMIPMYFDDLDVSARTDHGIIALNWEMLENGDIANEDHYGAHEVSHFCQQTTGDGPTEGSTDDTYLDNESEQEGFQIQTKYLSDTRNDETAKNYIEKVLDHHDVPNKDKSKRKKDLLRLASETWDLCDVCNEPADPETVNNTEDGDIICKACQEKECPNCGSKGKAPTKMTLSRSRSIPACKDCTRMCYVCDKWFDKDESIRKYPDGEFYCENCASDSWSYCEECNEDVDSDDIVCVDDTSLCGPCYNSLYVTCDSCNEPVSKHDAKENERGDSFCEKCFDELYTICYDCESVTDMDSIHEDEDGNLVCPTCYNKTKKTFEDVYPKIVTPNIFSFGKNDRQLNFLRKLLPISIRELKSKHPALSISVKDLIAFSNGKDLTEEILNSYSDLSKRKNYGIAYTLWNSSLQRSVENPEPQLTLNIIAPEENIQEMKENGVYDLFNKINLTSKESTHPYVEDQIGWARLELDPNGEYILVDEIQTDHMNAIDRIATETHQGRTFENHIKEKKGLTDEQWKEQVKYLKNFVKDFPDVAVSAISHFAKQNNYKKIYWHTYESGMKLKQNNPPKSIYTEVPKRNFFSDAPTSPFGLEGNFFEREARYKLYRKFLVKS